MDDYKFECICGKKYKYQQGLQSHGTKSSRHVNEGRGCPEYQKRRAEGKLVNVYGLNNEPVVINNNMTKTVNNNNIDNHHNDYHDNDNVNFHQETNTVNNNYKVKYEELNKNYKKLEDTHKTVIQLNQNMRDNEKKSDREIEKLQKDNAYLKKKEEEKDRLILNYERILGKHNIPF